LTDQYVAGAVEGAERDQMEKYFFGEGSAPPSGYVDPASG